MVRNGTLNYTYHPTTGELYFAGDLVVHVFCLCRKFEFAGSVNLKRSKDITLVEEDDGDCDSGH